jgi:Tfp pilus assembly protein PilO
VTPKRYFYVLCGVLGLLIVGGGFGYYFLSKSPASGTAELSQRLGDQQVAMQKLQALQDLQQQYQRLQPLIPTVYDALPNQKDQSTIALQLHDLAQNSGMNLDSLTFAPSTIPGPTSQTVAAGSVLAIPVTFQLSGSYAQLQAFLQGQERLNRYTSVTSLTITTSANGGLTFAITLNAYVKP